MENPLPDKYLKLLGNIAVNHSRLEFWLISSICIFAHKDYYETLCLIAGDQFDVLLTKLERVFYLIVEDANDRKDFEAMKGRLTKANNSRNNFLHGYWIGEEDGKVMRWKFSKRFAKTFPDESTKPEEIAFTDLETADREIESVVNDLRPFIENYHMKYELRIHSQSQTIPPT